MSHPIRMIRPLCLALLTLSLLLPLACARNYVEQPTLPEGVASAKPDLLADLDALLGSPNAPSEFVFCEADPETGVCEDADDGLSAIGVGGVALPLLMDLSSMSIERAERGDAGWTLRSKFSSRVNGIPPICRGATGTVSINEAGSANLEYDGFYCNWVVIGNVLTRFKLSIDDVDPETGRMSGYYALSFNGTGNAVGSGYFVATPRSADES